MNAKRPSFTLAATLFAAMFLAASPAQAQGAREPARTDLLMQSAFADDPFAGGVLMQARPGVRAAEGSARPRFWRLAGYGTLGAGVGAGALVLLADPLREALEDGRTLQQDDEIGEAAALLYLLPWIGGVTGTLVAARDPLRDGPLLFAVGGTSFFASLVGAGLGAVVFSGHDVGIALGFAAGAGTGAALGYLAAHQRGRRSLLSVAGGRWRLGLPAVRVMRGPVPAQAFSLLRVRL